MGFPIGLPSEQLPDGTWVGTTPEGIQRALGSMYSGPGVLPGNRTATKASGTSGWAYKVPALTAFMWISHAERRGVLVPVEAETVPVSAPVGGAARTDTIYIDLDGVVKVAEGKTKAPAGVTIDRMAVPAGATNTQGATSTWDTDYAIPAGASLGRLAYWQDPAGGAANQSKVTRYTKRIYVPSDRLVRVDLNTTIRAAGGVTGTSGRMAFGVSINGVWSRSMSCVYGPYYDTRSASWSTGVSEGANEVTVWTEGYGGTAWEFAPGQAVTEFSLWDMGADD